MTEFWKKFIGRAFFIAAISLAHPAMGQVSSGLTRSGPVTPGHISTWKNNSQLQDGGAAIISGGAAGGDLSGTYPNPGVAKIQTFPLNIAAPISGQCLVWNGTQWANGSCASGGAGTVTNVTLTSSGATISLTGTCTSVSVFSCNIELPNKVTAGSYGAADHSLVVTLDAQGRTTAIVSNPIAITMAQVSGTLPSGQFGPLTGDVATLGYAATVQPNVIDNSKLAQATGPIIKGRDVATLGNVLDLTPAQVTASFCNLATASLKGCLPVLSGVSTNYFGGDGAEHPLPTMASVASGSGISVTGGPAYSVALAPIAANAVLQNATAGSAAPTGVVIPNCTSGGTSLLYSTTTHTWGCSAQTAFIYATPAAAGASSSTTGIMAGFGATCKITPALTGRVRFTFVGNMSNNTSLARPVVILFYGTGTAPANGVVPTGTQAGDQLSGNVALANGQLPFTQDTIVVGLSVGTQYWFDLDYFGSSGTNTLTNIRCIAQEF